MGVVMGHLHASSAGLGLEVGSLVKSMSGARTGDGGAWRVMVPLEGVVLGLLHA